MTEATANETGATQPASTNLLLDPLNTFMAPYIEAGHDGPSLFYPGQYRCCRCGTHQIDLSEDLSYGPMRTCSPPPAQVSESIIY